VRVLSLGLGIQSTALYLMSSRGECEIPRADVAIFADTGAEHPDTIKLGDWLLEWQKDNAGIPLHYIRERNYLDDIRDAHEDGESRVPSMPAFMKGSGMVNRQCTDIYKIRQVMGKVKELCGARTARDLPEMEMWLGISVDEAHRMKPNPKKKITNIFPLIDAGLSRLDCINYMKQFDCPNVRRSACVFCPFQSGADWQDLKENHPEQWKIACEVDEKYRAIAGRVLNSDIYVNRACVPLKDIEFADQIDLFGGECGGFCGL
jgi:hypothetical protein